MSTTLAGVSLLGAIVLAAAGDPTWNDLKGLGVIALALIVGATGVYRWGVVPARKARDDDLAAERKARVDDVVAERERAERERADKLAAEARERQLRDAYEARTVPLLDATRVLGELLIVLKQRTGG